MQAKEMADIRRKLRILTHADSTGNVSFTCRYFGISREAFYRWRKAYETKGEKGLINSKPCPENPKIRLSKPIEEKILYLRQTYHLGQLRISWFLKRYHDIKVSPSGIHSVLKRNGLNRLPKNLRKRSLPQFKRYEKQVPGHRIQIDVKFLDFKSSEGKKIRRFQSLYMTKNRYCRENWVPLLEARKSEDKVILMTDASKQSLPKEQELERLVSAVCLGGHARQKFKEVEDYYPDECSYFLNLISDLYKNESACKDKSPQERLDYHQEHSTAIIDALYSKITELFEKRMIEPNSVLGKAMNYWLNHQKGLTAFLRVAGVPLDNNWGENALRVMAVYRKASLFFKTFQSALVMSDMFSLVVTCEANGINAFLYLNWVQKYWKEVQVNPEDYMPWHFKNETEKIVA